MQKTVIVIPCYNEAGRLNKSEFINFARSEPDLRFIFVNDGSTDDTPKLLAEISETDPEHLHCVSLERNAGKAEAVRQGFLRAFEMSADYVGYWDADLSTPLPTIREFIELMGTRSANIVMGSRVSLMGRRIIRRRWRHYLGRSFATTVSMILNLPVYDTQCGAKLFRNTGDLRKVFSTDFKTRWIFDVEIIARFLLVERKGISSPGTFGQTTVEYPLEEWAEMSGSKLRPGDFVKAMTDLIRIYFMLRVFRKF